MVVSFAFSPSSPSSHQCLRDIKVFKKKNMDHSFFKNVPCIFPCKCTPPPANFRLSRHFDDCFFFFKEWCALGTDAVILQARVLEDKGILSHVFLKVVSIVHPKKSSAVCVGMCMFACITSVTTSLCIKPCDRTDIYGQAGESAYNF